MPTPATQPTQPTKQGGGSVRVPVPQRDGNTVTYYVRREGGTTKR
jgi:hypothetical protein